VGRTPRGALPRSPAGLVQGQDRHHRSTSTRTGRGLAQFHRAKAHATVGQGLADAAPLGVPWKRRWTAALHLHGVCWPLKHCVLAIPQNTDPASAHGGCFGPAGSHLAWARVLPLTGFGSAFRSPQSDRGAFSPAGHFPRPPEKRRVPDFFFKDQQLALGAGKSKPGSPGGRLGWVGMGSE